MSETLLSVEDLKVHFEMRVGGLLVGRYAPLKAVDGVSFDLKAGETLGIVGESGCGKSTLGRAILRLIEPTAGRAVWLGEDLAALAAPLAYQRLNAGAEHALGITRPGAQALEACEVGVRLRFYHRRKQRLSGGEVVLQIAQGHSGLRGHAAHHHAVITGINQYFPGGCENACTGGCPFAA